MNNVISVVAKVLLDLRVIGTAVAVVLVMEFGKYIASYQKKPPRPVAPKQKAAPAKTEEKKEEAPAEEAGESS